MSADGDTLVGSGNLTLGTGPEAWKWKRGLGLESLGFDGTAQAVSADGSIITGSKAGANTFVWSAGVVQTYSGTQSLAASGPWAMSGSGPHVVARGLGYHAVRWSPMSGTEDIGNLPGFTYSEATGISQNADVIVGSSFTASGVYRAFRWTAPSAMQDLGVLPGNDSSAAYAVSLDGTVVVGRSFIAPLVANDIGQAFRWKAGLGVRPLSNFLGGSYATSASADGSVIVGIYANYRPFVWTPRTGLVDFESTLAAHGAALSGFQFGQRIWVSASGRKFGGQGSGGQGARPWAAEFPVGFGCYANCDGSVAAPVLNANDFQCFLNLFAAGDSYANCDDSLSPPILNAGDFQCFLNKFAAGCP